MPVSGDVFVRIDGGAIYVTQSNTVQVDTLVIESLTTNIVSPAILQIGQTGIIVTMSARNTSAARSIALNEAALHFYKRQFAGIPAGQTPADFNVDNAFTVNWQNPMPAIAAGTTADLVFLVSVTNNVAFFPRAWLVVDGYLRYENSYYDNYWSRPEIYGALHQYAARETALWDASGQPEVDLLLVTPNPARAGVVTVNVHFNEDMDSAKPLSVAFNVGAIYSDYFTGSWTTLQDWTGVFNIYWTGGTHDGVASLNISGGYDLAGNVMLPHPDIYSFVIDTVPPTLSVWPATQTANVGINLPVTLAADAPLAVTPQAELHISGNIIAPVTVVSELDRVTWNGYVHIPVTALPAVGTVATFNLPSGYAYADLAGNTSNILLGLLTVNVAEAAPIIVTVDFDTMPARDGLIISAGPYISAYVLDYKQIGLDPSSVRVTVDGALVYSGPAQIYKTAEIPYWLYQIDWQYPVLLDIGEHIFEFGLSDKSGIAAAPYIVRVSVRSRGTDLVRPPVPAPNPFSPNEDGKDDTTTLVYQLTNSTDINLYIYDINGNVVWRKFIPRGQEGAHAGLNKVVWDGRASFNNNQILPNGVYICHLLIEKGGEKKSLGRAKILILN
ncbi:MAG: gliding motility-associated C-terminal domain-containing protein [Candidatus Margulisbacteria bacterium]|nr:gliding motility-associated C-terminal domain-containing protein [Candidatus Margulisiibacteriota bacterium]